MEFAAKLRAMRAIQNMTQAELSRESGVSQQEISMLEKGTVLPVQDTEEKIRDSLGWSGEVDIGFRIIERNLPRELSARVLAIGEELDVETW